MALNVMELVAKITLDSSEYETGLGKLGSFAGGAMKAIGGALAGATTAATAFAGQSVKVGAAFDSSMSQVAATMGNVDDMTNEAFENLKRNASELGVAFDNTTTATELSRNVLRAFAQEEGASTAFSATQAADALNYMALAGYDANQSIEALPNVLNLAAAGDMALASASDMVTDAQSALGLTMEQTAELVDKMATASSKSNTRVAQLGEAILTVGGTAKNLAGGTTELATSLGILADNGVKGAEGGTALRNIILSLSAPTDKAAKLMGRLGLEVFDADGNMRPLNETFSDLDAILGEMTQQEQTEVLNQLFNKVDLKSVNALLANNNERFDELSGYIDKAAGSAQKMADTQLDNLAGDVTLFKSALEGVQIVISDALTPTLRDFVKFGSDGLSSLTEAFKTDGLAGAMDELGVIISDGLDMILNMLPTMVDAGMHLLQSLLDGIITNLPKITDAALQIILNLVDGILNNLPSVVEAALTIIVTLGQGLIKALPKLVPKIADVVVKVAETLTEPSNFEMLIEAAIQLILALADGLIQAIPTLVRAVPVIVKNIVQALIAETPSLIVGAIQLTNGLVVGFAEGALELLALVPQLIASMVKGIENGIKDFVASGVDIVDGLQKGIEDAWNGFLDGVKSLFDLLVKTVKNLLGISSPSKVFHGVGDNIVQGLWNGIRDLWTSFTSFVSSIFNGIINTVKSILGLNGGEPVFLRIGKDIINGLWDGAREIWARLTSWVSDAFNGLVSSVKRLLGLDGGEPIFLTIGKNIVNGLWDGIRSVWDGLADGVTGLFGGLVDTVTSLFDEHSPSKVFEKIGRNVSLGFEQGVIGEADAVENAGASIAKNVGSGFRNSLDDIAGRVSSSINVGVVPTVMTAVNDGSVSQAGAASRTTNNATTYILTLLEQYLPQLANTQITLDTGKLVGAISPGVDDNLGWTARRKAREGYANWS